MLAADQTGTHTHYALYQGCQIVTHVSTELPFRRGEEQQLLRKRHIGKVSEPSEMPLIDLSCELLPG